MRLRLGVMGERRWSEKESRRSDKEETGWSMEWLALIMQSQDQ